MGDLIYIDMDSTMFDYIKQYSKFHFIFTGERIYPNEDDMSKYHINELFGVPDRFKYMYLNEEFFATMDPYDGSVDVISKLKDLGFDIRFVTHIVTDVAYRGKVRRLKMLFDWFNFEDHLIAIKDKHLLRPSFIIDDNPYVLSHCMENGFTTVKFKHKWNENCSCHKEVGSWHEILEYFNEHIHRKRCRTSGPKE